jgi:flagellar hook-associated protein 3 FlgL
MTRVSEGSSAAAIKYSINKTKRKLEKLQLQGATLKSMSSPSDDPVSNVESMQLQSIRKDNGQYMRNADFALMQLNVTEKSLENLTEILSKAKEIAIAQSSDIYNPEVRKNVANEVIQLRNMALSIANKRIGQRYIFGGFKTLETPFDRNGNYRGDEGHITLEVSKDFFVQTNLNGAEVFFADSKFDSNEDHPLNEFPEMNSSPRNEENLKNTKETMPNGVDKARELASVENAKQGYERRENIFSLLETLSNALENGDADVVQNLLERFDDATSRLITMRTRVGSIVGSVENSKNTLESDNIDNAARRSKIVDADIAELFTDLSKQQEVLKTTYKSTQGLLNQKLLDFLR